MDDSKKPLSDPDVRREAHQTMTKLVTGYARAKLSREWEEIEAVQRRVDAVVGQIAKAEVSGVEILEEDPHRVLLRHLTEQKNQLIVEAMKRTD